MSPWTHAICAACWTAQHPGALPVQVTSGAQRCCYCDQPTTDGIFVRDDPTTTPCRGEGAGHAA